MVIHTPLRLPTPLLPNRQRVDNILCGIAYYICIVFITPCCLYERGVMFSYKHKMMFMKSKLLLGGLIIALCLQTTAINAQGISVSPSRLYYTLQQGINGSQRIRVDNPSKYPMEIGISVGDWNYDSLGNNRMYETGTLKASCAKWLQILPGSYFTLQPGGQQWVSVAMTVPANADTSVPLRTAMIYFTQLNAIGPSHKDQKGAAIQIRVQMGVKIYHNFSTADTKGMEITNFQDTTISDKDKKQQHVLCLQLQNTGRMWVEGSIKWELLNEQNGKKIKLDDTNVYSLPGDNRYIIQALPATMTKGKYSATAIVDYGNKDDLKIAELEFVY